MDNCRFGPIYVNYAKIRDTIAWFKKHLDRWNLHRWDMLVGADRPVLNID